METLNGEFIMKGCDENDPAALHTVSACRLLIQKIGFLPLFSNTIPGFSVEEHVPVSYWWTGEPETDPWEWRMILAADPDIAYGKFFNRNAGFVSKDFFPTFANYRRNGYDFDALFEDELASWRTKKIMDVFECDGDGVGKSLLTTEIREHAGKDETALTDLQMQSYLIMSDFRQRKNKKGQPYGWYLAVLETPETKWGRDAVASGYTEDPKESWKKIVSRMKEYFPDAGEDQINRLLGIRYPGEMKKKANAPKKEKTRQPKEWVIPANPRYYDIEAAFTSDNEIVWKQGAGIRKGDTVYVYVAAPVSAILYKCCVIETDIPYSYDNGKVRMKALMKIRLEKKYPRDRFTFDMLGKEYGIHAVRGPRGIPDSLREALKQ